MKRQRRHHCGDRKISGRLSGGGRDPAARVPDPRYLYYGKDIWEEAITAILCGENLLLVGPKATGKNVLAENQATVFGPPQLERVLLHQHRRRHPAGHGHL